MVCSQIARPWFCCKDNRPVRDVNDPSDSHGHKVAGTKAIASVQG